MGSEEIMATDSISDNGAEMSICSESMLKSPSGVGPFFSCGWDPIVSGDQTGNSSLVHPNEFANPHYPLLQENQTMGVHFTCDSSLLDMMVQKIPSFGSGSFSEMVSNEHCQNSEDGALGALLNGKRKRKNVDVEQQKDPNGDTNSEFHKDDDEKNIKQAAKQTKANSNGAEPCKENYLLLRAKRGQATNTHSLAERVRREKISERMKLLQELVPGCNKITGKAVMLDEIINYVQSLQHQVEFLSMKLATVNPELNVDIERLLTSKDLLHPQGGNARPGLIGPGLSSSHAFPGLPLIGTINGFPGTAPPFHPLPPNLWNNELQSILQMGFNSDGLSKMEEL